MHLYNSSAFIYKIYSRYKYTIANIAGPLFSIACLSSITTFNWKYTAAFLINQLPRSYPHYTSNSSSCCYCRRSIRSYDSKYIFMIRKQKSTLLVDSKYTL